jgi:hypothetical protein
MINRAWQCTSAQNMLGNLERSGRGALISHLRSSSGTAEDRKGNWCTGIPSTGGRIPVPLIREEVCLNLLLARKTSGSERLLPISNALE